MDWMKKFKLTIRRILLAENSQSKRKKYSTNFLTYLRTMSFDINKRKTQNKRRTNVKNGTIRKKTEKNFGTRTCSFYNAPNWTPMHKNPASETN